jgi:hypothetical protein
MSDAVSPPGKGLTGPAAQNFPLCCSDPGHSIDEAFLDCHQFCCVQSNCSLPMQAWVCIRSKEVGVMTNSPAGRSRVVQAPVLLASTMVATISLDSLQ